MQQTWNPERTDWHDAHTGRRVIQWTHDGLRNQHLYFTSHSVTHDNRWLVFISDRDGHPNLYTVDRSSGSIHRLSCNRRGLLKSYCYSHGGNEGLNKIATTLDTVRNRLFYVQDNTLMCVGLEERCASRLWEVPRGWWVNFTHVCPQGSTLCVPCTDARAFAQDDHDQAQQCERVPDRMRQKGLASRIYRVDTNTGHAEIWAEVRHWVTHVQFEPTGSGRLVFNAEGWDAASTERIWCLERDGVYRRLWDQDRGTMIAHENWAPSGGDIVYHVADVKTHAHRIEVRGWNGELRRRYAVPDVELPWHVTMTMDGTAFVTEGVAKCISLLHPAGRGLTVEPLCRHDNEVCLVDQDTHCHALATPDNGGIVFANTRDGKTNVYEVQLS